MSTPIYHLAKLDVATNVPLEIIEELFIKRGLEKDSFSIHHLTDKNNNTIVLFDYPVGMKEEEFKTFLNNNKRELNVLSSYYSADAITNIVKQL